MKLEVQDTERKEANLKILGAELQNYINKRNGQIIQTE